MDIKLICKMITRSTMLIRNHGKNNISTIDRTVSDIGKSRIGIIVL
jgi:hypothetical protein